MRAMPGKKRKTTTRRNRTVIFVDCAEELKKRVRRAAGFTDRSLSDYVVHALKRQLAVDEAEMKKAL
jgi:hypothetical protein